MIVRRVLMTELVLLIVEDNPGDTLLIKEYLNQKKEFSYHFVESDTLKSACDLLSRQNFDVVLLDLSLPDSSGLDTVRKVVSKFPSVPVVVLTGLQDDETARLAVRYGAQDYLDKQFISPEVLSRSIIYAIERKKTMQDKEELLVDLAHALNKIDKLEGMLPMCVNCKKIIDENKKWQTVEQFISQRSDISIVPLICPECKNDMGLNSDA